MTAVWGAQVLRLVKAGDVGEDPRVVGEYLVCACGAGPRARWAVWEWDINEAAQYAVSGGHTAVVDLLAGEFGAWIVVGCSIREAMWGHDAMIDRLVERYGVDPIAVDGAGWTALPCLESDRIPVRVTITSSDRHRDGWGVRGSAEAGKHPRCPQRTRHVHSPGDTLT